MSTERLVLAICVLVLGCASAPKPKQPDEDNRMPINKTVPAEVRLGK